MLQNTDKNKTKNKTLKGKRLTLHIKHNTFLYIFWLKTKISIRKYGHLARYLFSQLCGITIKKMFSMYLRIWHLNKFIESNQKLVFHCGKETIRKKIFQGELFCEFNWDIKTYVYTYTYTHIDMGIFLSCKTKEPGKCK